jgi:hypothetical protein
MFINSLKADRRMVKPLQKLFKKCFSPTEEKKNLCAFFFKKSSNCMEPEMELRLYLSTSKTARPHHEYILCACGAVDGALVCHLGDPGSNLGQVKFLQ